MERKKSLSTLMNQTSLNLEVAQLIKGIREQKELSQEEVCEKANISRQYLSEIENGRRARLNLETVAQIVDACGEQLGITSSFKHTLQVSDQTVKEDQILNAFAEGRIEDAEILLAQIRRWRYPTKYVIAKCKRMLAVAISYHFRGVRGHSQEVVSHLVMGLAAIGCGEEAERFIEMYYRIIEQGEKEQQRLYREKKREEP